MFIVYNLNKLHNSVLARIFLVLIAVMCIACFKAFNNLVSIHCMLTYVDNTDGNVGAMVTHTLKVGNEIRPYKSGFNGTRAFLKSCDVVITEKRFQIVDHLFKRLNVVCKSNIVVNESGFGQGKYFIRCGTKNSDFLSCGRRELNAFFTKLLYRFKNVYGMVGDTLREYPRNDSVSFSVFLIFLPESRE